MFKRPETQLSEIYMSWTLGTWNHWPIQTDIIYVKNAESVKQVSWNSKIVGKYLFEVFNSRPVQSERPDGISGLLGGFSRRRLPRPLPVWVPTVCPLVQCLSSCRAERRGSRREKREEEERPQRASETRVSLRFVLQGHAGCYQGTKSQRYVWRGFEDRGLHVGQSGGGAETGERMPAVMEIWRGIELLSFVSRI